MKKFSKYIPAAAGIFFAFTGCQNAADSSSDTASSSGTTGVTGIVSGVVLEKGASVVTPVEGAVVSMGGYATVTTDSNGVWVIKGVTPNYSSSAGAKSGDGYTAVVTKKDYAPATVNGIWVNAHQYVDDDPYNEKAVSDALIGVLTAYSTELNNLTTLTIESSGTAASEDGTTTVSLTDLSSSVSSLASGMSKVAYTYSVSASVAKMAPLTCSLKGAAYLCNVAIGSTEGKTVVSAPEGMTVLVRGYTDNTVDDNTYGTATTTAAGIFSVDKLPAATDLALVVPGFNYTIDGKMYYFSTYNTHNVLEFSAAWRGDGFSSSSQLIIDGQATKTSLSGVDFILYAQPTKIIVTGNNVGAATENTPLATTGSLTFTFDRAMKSLTPTFYTSESVNTPVTEDVSVAWDSGKTTATITASDGKFDGSIKYIVLSGEGSDGCKTFEQSKYEVNFDATIKVSSTNAGEATILAPLARTTPLTFTFDRAMTDLSVSFTDGSSSVAQETALSWSTDYKTVTVTPAGGTFSTSIKNVHLAGTAQDGSTAFSQSDYDVNFLLFGVQSVNVIDSSAVPTDASTVSVSAARSAVAVTSSQYLALTFNDTIASAAVYMGTADAYGSKSLLSVRTKDKALYIPFGDAVNTASADLQVWGTVESSKGDTSTCAFGSSDWKLDAYFAYPEYRISASNLYAVTDAINSTDDATIRTIAPGTAITLTFDKAFASGAAASVELYKSTDDTITANSITASASVSGSTVTITPAAGLEAGLYNMSLKVVSDSTTLFTTVNKIFGTTGYEKNIFDENKTGYITFTVTDPVILVGNRYATTTKIAQDEAVVLEFDQDVTGYNAILTTSKTSVDSTNSYTKEVKAQKNAGTYIPAAPTVSSKTMTVTPELVLVFTGSAYVYIYNGSGELLRSVYNSQGYFPVTVKTTSVDPMEKATGTISLVNAASEIDSSTALAFSFKPFALAEDGSSTSYSIKKKTYNAAGVLSGWTDTTTVLSVSPLEYARQEAVTITIPQESTDYNYGSHAVSYALIAHVNNMYYCSNAVVVSDAVNPVFSGSAISDVNSINFTETATGAACSVTDANTVNTITFTVKTTSGESIKGMKVTSSISDPAIHVAESYTDDGTGVTVTVSRNGGTFNSVVTHDDTITVSFTDMSGNAAHISATNTSTNYSIKFE